MNDDSTTETGATRGALAFLTAQVMRPIAKGFGLAKKGENRWFDNNFKTVAKLARMDLSKEAKQYHKEMAFRSVDAAGRLLKDAIDGNASTDAIGHRHVKRLPSTGRYVVFSDHHITPFDHRQNFFITSGNQDLYVEALAQYDAEGFTLIENGDVEELLIWEPTVHRDLMEQRMAWDDLGDDAYERELPKKLIEHRLVARFRQLDDILNEPKLQPYRDALAAFDRDGRLVRVAGNHDYNLQGRAFLERFQQVFPNVENVYDYVLIDDGDHTRFAVMHGHQFDLTTNPTSAPRNGETFSECLAIFFEGGDRTWPWNADDSKPGDDLFLAEPEDWSTGRAPFNNGLVEDNHANWVPAFDEPPLTGREDIPHGVDHVGDVIPTLPELRAQPGQEPPDEAPLRAFLPPELWEELFGHAVAWEHFKHPDPTTAIFEEVLSGERSFKYRHTNEQELARQLMTYFTDDERPVVIFGHTHEPRIHSTIPDDFLARLRSSPRPEDAQIADRLEAMGRFPWYANSAAAGRFERMIFGIEVDRGELRLVSWARTDEGVERRVWETTNKGVIAKGDGHTPLP